VLKGLSIGYDTIDSDFVGDVRQLKELRLWEGSIVTFPMSPEAMVTGIKGMSGDDLARHLRAIDRHQKAIRQSLKALGLDDDEPVDPPSESDDETSALLDEIRSLVESAQELS
jgi:hypothetical protein